MKRITFISDTHGKHNQLNLIGGDILIHCGDISPNGKKHMIEDFCKWFSKTDYTNKIFIAGNHDWLFQTDPNIYKEIVNLYDIHYLFDSHIEIDGIKIYGSPWQPEFCNWAFNLSRNGQDLETVWNKIPVDVDLLITHGPSYGHLDTVTGRSENLGCEILRSKIDEVKPKIHVCGHIHTGYGYKFNGYTHMFNASVLNEQYIYVQKPITIEWNKDINEIKMI